MTQIDDLTQRKIKLNSLIYRLFAVFSREEMQNLYERALDFVGSQMHQFEVLYRCKPKPYYDDIKYNRDGIMEKYIKDNNGQAASPINGRYLKISTLMFK